MMPDDIPNPKLISAIERRVRSDAVKNRQLLLDTAGRLFATRGVDHVTMSEVADAAGVGKGTLYRHFTGKTDLCSALLDQDQRDLQTRTLQRLTDRATPPLAHLRWFCEQVAAFVVRNLPMVYIIGDASAPSTLDLPAHRWYRQTIRALLDRSVRSPDLDYLADTLFVMLDAHTIRYQIVVRGLDLASVQRGLNLLIDCIITRS
jgi:AcrR family transcriptional regulator